jgi:hypothetical protein
LAKTCGVPKNFNNATGGDGVKVSEDKHNINELKEKIVLVRETTGNCYGKSFDGIRKVCSASSFPHTSRHICRRGTIKL